MEKKTPRILSIRGVLFWHLGRRKATLKLSNPVDLHQIIQLAQQQQLLKLRQHLCASESRYRTHQCYVKRH